MGRKGKIMEMERLWLADPRGTRDARTGTEAKYPAKAKLETARVIGHHQRKVMLLGKERAACGGYDGTSATS